MVCLSICPSVRLSVCLSVCLGVHSVANIGYEQCGLLPCLVGAALPTVCLFFLKSLFFGIQGVLNLSCLLSAYCANRWGRAWKSPSPPPTRNHRFFRFSVACMAISLLSPSLPASTSTAQSLRSTDRRSTSETASQRCSRTRPSLSSMRYVWLMCEVCEFDMWGTRRCHVWGIPDTSKYPVAV